MFQNMHNNTLIIFIVVILCFLPLLPYVAAQDSSKRNSSSGGDALTPSTVIIIIMAIIFLFTACLAVFLRRFAHGCFGLHIIPTNYPDSISDDRLATKGGLDADLIKSLPTYLYADVKQHRKLGQVELECAVCLNEFQDPEALRLLPGCSHVFHPRCIDRWLAGHATCPVCRQSLLETESDKHPQHITINITEAAAAGTAEETAAGQEGPSSTEDDNQLEGMEKKRVVGKFSRCHSTGHSIRIMGSAEKYTLELPAEYRYNKKINNNNNNNNNNGDRLRRGLLLSASCMASPKSGYNYKCGLFPMTPPLNKIPTNSGSRSFRTLVSSSLFKSSSSKNLAEHAGRQLV